MADRVIVVGATRGRQRVPASEIMQMLGRAGRKHDGGECRATIVVEEDFVEELTKDMNTADSYAVTSTFANRNVMAFHILPEICSGNISNTTDARCWYSRSLGCAQGVKVDFGSVFELLAEQEAVFLLGDKYTATELGKVSSRFYFAASDLKAWRDSFTKLFDLGFEENDCAIAWAMACAPSMRTSGDFGRHWEVVERYKDGLPPGLDTAKSSTTSGTLWWHVLGGPPLGKMKNRALVFRADVGRVVSALKELDARVTHWNKTQFFDEMRWRARRGIPSSLAELCRIEGITKSRAAYLGSVGIIGKEDIRSSIGQLKNEVDTSFYVVLKEIADGIRQ